MDGITAAYVAKDVDIHLAKGASFNEEEIAEILKKYKMTVRSSKKLDTLPF